MVKNLHDLRVEHRKLQQAHRTLCEAYAHAAVYALPTAQDLRETLMAHYDKLTALELVIASFDPQEGLFSDYSEEGPRS